MKDFNKTLVEEKSFKVNTLNNNALGTPDYKAKFEFLKKAADLNIMIGATSSYAGELVSSIGVVKRSLGASSLASA